jgi:PAS domain S-box-containing protein
MVTPPPSRHRRFKKVQGVVEGVDVFEHAAIGMVLRAIDGQILRVNPALTEMLGRLGAERVAGPGLQRFVRDDGTEMWGLVTQKPVLDDQGEVVATLAQVVDVTELKTSELRLATAHRISRTGYWERDLRTGEASWSEQTFRLLGYEPGEVEPGPAAMTARIAPEDRDAVAGALAAQLPTGRLEFEARVIHPDGTERHLLAVAEVETDPESGVPVRLVGTVRDVTEQVRAREERLDLLARLTEGHEEERRRIGRELHDDLGQLLVSASLFVKSVEIEGTPQVQNLLERAAELIDTSIERVRSAATRLHPGDLDEGLELALRRMVRGLSDAGGVVIDLDVALGWEPSVEVGTAALRIVGEALTNAVRHAVATRVEVSVVSVDDVLVAEVADDGVGMARPAEGRTGLGLRSMRERAEVVGGSVEVGPGRSGGTVVRARLPLGAPEGAL